MTGRKSCGTVPLKWIYYTHYTIYSTGNVYPITISVWKVAALNGRERLVWHFPRQQEIRKTFFKAILEESGSRDCFCLVICAAEPELSGAKLFKGAGPSVRAKNF